MSSPDSTRRGFLKTASLASLVIASTPELLVANPEKSPKAGPKKVALATNDVIVFQGDSITDAGRKRDSPETNTPAILGNGYAYLAAAQLLGKHANKNLKIYNRGVSGNRVPELTDRWDADCLDLNPTVLSILVGVNDFWHTLDGKYNGTLPIYRDKYAALLTRTRQRYPNVKLIMGEPFLVKGVKEVDEKWRTVFPGYQAAARELATQFNAVWIPYQSLFDKAEQIAPGSYWSADGVHPTVAGSQLMAQAWLETIQG